MGLDREQEIAIFFHVFPIRRYSGVVFDIMESLGACGLLDKALETNVCVVKAALWHECMPMLARWPQAKSQLVKHHDFEWPTLKRLWLWAQDANPNDLVLYVHTKGVANDRHGKAEDWRNMMVYFCIECWEEAIALFDDPAVAAVGCNLKNKQPRKAALKTMQKAGIPNFNTSKLWHFSGNFWWARASAICRLPDPDSEEARLIPTWKGFKRRLQAERWIAGVGSKRLFSLHQAKVDLNSTRYPRKLYVKQQQQKQTEEIIK